MLCMFGQQQVLNVLDNFYIFFLNEYTYNGSICTTRGRINCGPEGRGFVPRGGYTPLAYWRISFTVGSLADVGFKSHAVQAVYYLMPIVVNITKYYLYITFVAHVYFTTRNINF